MKKTGSQIEKDVYSLVTDSVIASTINGNVYRDEMRPHNSTKEDAVVIFTTALDGHNQEGLVNINVYVPDKMFGKRLVKDVTRCVEIEEACQSFFDSLPTNQYLFSLGQLIQTFEEQTINQHFINVKLKFKHNTLI